MSVVLVISDNALHDVLFSYRFDILARVFTQVAELTLDSVSFWAFQSIVNKEAIPNSHTCIKYLKKAWLHQSSRYVWDDDVRLWMSLCRQSSQSVVHHYWINSKLEKTAILILYIRQIWGHTIKFTYYLSSLFWTVEYFFIYSIHVSSKMMICYCWVR